MHGAGGFKPAYRCGEDQTDRQTDSPAIAAIWPGLKISGLEVDKFSLGR